MPQELATINASLPALPDAIAERLAEYSQDARGAFAANTTRAIKADTRIFADWCAAAGVDALPASPDTVAAFVDAMAAVKAVATVRRYVSSIAHAHRAAGAGEPTRADKVKLALKRAARAKGTRQRQAAPLGRTTLDAILAGLGDRPIDLRNRALVLVAYDSWVRRSALVAIQVEDIATAEDGAGSVLIRREKTDQEGQGSARYLAPDTLKAINAWLAAAGIASGPVFRSVTKWGQVGEQLKDGEIPAIIRKMAAAAGVDPAGLSGHSARVGKAQDCIAAGLDIGEIMKDADWKTPTMVIRYSERLLVSRGASAKLAKAQGRA